MRPPHRFGIFVSLFFAIAPLAHGQSAVSFTLSDSPSNPGSTYTGLHMADTGSHNTYVVGFQAQITAIDGNSYSVPPVVAFCTELQESVGLGSYTYTAAPLEFASAGRAGESGTASSAMPPGGIGMLAAAQVRWLYDNHADSETLSSWAFSQSDPASQAFQLALWEITHDSDLNIKSTSGEVYVGYQSSTTRNNARDLAQSWLNELSAAGIDENYTSQTMNVWAMVNTTGNGSGSGYQDVLFATRIGSTTDTLLVNNMTVPEPSTTLVSLLGFSVLFQRRRR